VDAEDEDEAATVGKAVEGGHAAVAVPARRAQEKKTQADRNREKRRRDAEDDLAARRKLKKQRRELDSVKQYHGEIARQEALQVSLFFCCTLFSMVPLVAGLYCRLGESLADKAGKLSGVKGSCRGSHRRQQSPSMSLLLLPSIQCTRKPLDSRKDLSM
jgi:hypothetical protein